MPWYSPQGELVFLDISLGQKPKEKKGFFVNNWGSEWWSYSQNKGLIA